MEDYDHALKNCWWKDILIISKCMVSGIKYTHIVV